MNHRHPTTCHGARRRPVLGASTTSPNLQSVCPAAARLIRNSRGALRQMPFSASHLLGMTSAHRVQTPAAHKRLRLANRGRTCTSREGLAERQGFEPWRRFPAYTLSRRAPSTTRPPLRGLALYKTRRGAQGGGGGRSFAVTLRVHGHGDVGQVRPARFQPIGGRQAL